MASSPKKLTERPDSVEGRGVDVLAEVLDTLRLSTRMHGRFELFAPWGLQFGTSPGAHIILVARGGARLEVEG
ncbi:MAG: AraC family transcriptional regulator, partial [Myxococcaceae bacterium]